MARGKAAPLMYSAADEQRVVPSSRSDIKLEKWRSEYRRDYGRLIHCPAFRRLQGKTQLFPSPDNDFFRTRYSHSLEVAQIATSIVSKLNCEHDFFRKHPIDRDIVETAALAHDLGHPPFGHNGEYALDEKMKGYGGFEGNAQTLRLLTRIEKRQTLPIQGNSQFQPLNGTAENRAGLNLTYRTLAAVLKYDNEIPLKHTDREDEKEICKGYYRTEADIVAKIKEAIPHKRGAKFRTVECSIMDVADDIAYSTYDLEDAFKAEFLTPLSITGQREDVRAKAIETIQKRLEKYYGHLSKRDRLMNDQELISILANTFAEIVYEPGAQIVQQYGRQDPYGAAFGAADQAFAGAMELVSSGYSRTKLTSDLVANAIAGIEVVPNEEFPSQSVVRLNVETFKRVEALKNINYQALIMSPRLKVAEHRGKQIVGDIFDALMNKGGHLLMPADSRFLYDNIKGTDNKARIVCDFIACMTDRYALSFYNRLFGTSHESIYTPH